jgi:biotin carboxylase
MLRRLARGSDGCCRDNGAVEAKRLLVLGAGPAQLGVLAAARRRGLQVVAADRDPAAPGFPLADRRAIVSIEDEPAIDRLARAEDVHGLIAPGTDHAVPLAARIAARFALPHPVSPDTALLAASKRRQRERLAEAGVPQPRSILCRTLEEVLAAADELGYPCVIEAPDRAGERGVALAADRAAVGAAAVEAVAESRNDYCLVEELVGGRVVTVTGFVLDGKLVPLTLTDREQAPAPAFGVTLAQAWPAALDEPEADAAVALAAAAAEALGVSTGPVAAQVLLGGNGPLLAKLSARTGGGHDSDLCRVATGVDLDDLAVAAALGEELAPQRLQPRLLAGGACVSFLVAPEGELAETRGLEKAREVAGVRAVHAYRSRGHRFAPLRRASDRAGAVLATGETRAEAERAAAAAVGLVDFLVAAPAGAAA